MLDRELSNQPFFKQIESTTASARQRLEQTPAIARCLQGRVEMQTYQAFLIEAYHHVRHTVPLLMACGSRLPQRLEWLREAIVHYIEEEVGHQEWILNDLQNLGVDKEPVRRGCASLPTELMVSYAYDTIARNNPVSLFGMVYALEKTSSTIATYAAGQIASRLELSPGAMSYMVSHGSLDVEHMQDFERLMNRLDDDDDKAAVLYSVSVFYELYMGIFESLPITTAAMEVDSHAA
ncbi:MAG: iron-containing redox enzyme family protein [Gammaproteobacteria bacterium]|nr:iron-containing redox enzyme family protein [Gammaproteobacteria bacterium]